MHKIRNMYFRGTTHVEQLRHKVSEPRVRLFGHVQGKWIHYTKDVDNNAAKKEEKRKT